MLQEWSFLLEKLRKEDFTPDTIIRGNPVIKFYHSGLISLNKNA